MSGGRVTSGLRVDDRRNDLFEMTVEPDGDGDVTIELPEGRECTRSGAICTKGENRRQLTNTPTATVAGPADDAPEPNTPATGAPTIGGTPQVGEELTASTSDISDADGLDDARFAYQWIRTDTDIRGATGSTYTAVEADEGERLKVRVSFTDDAGNAESLTSAATDAVAARPVPLTASFEGMPAEHRGEGGFPSGRLQRGHRDQLQGAARGCVRGDRRAGHGRLAGGRPARPVQDDGAARLGRGRDDHAAGGSRVRRLRCDLHPRTGGS